MRYFDKAVLTRLKVDANMVGLNIDDYMYMMTHNVVRDEHVINWLKKHERFVDFCLNIKDDIINQIAENKIAVIHINDMIKFIDEYCISISGLGIYDKKELMMGLYFYFIDVDIDVYLGKDVNHIKFKNKIID